MKKINNSGFTLIELAIVLFVVGLMLGGLLAPLSNKIEYENRLQTANDLEDIKDTLLGFVMLNGYFPCPDTDADGLENTVAQNSDPDAITCANAQGALPYITLGNNGNDAWENDYTYRVDLEFANRNGDAAEPTDGVTGDTCTATANISFSLCSSGNIVVQDSATGTPATIADGIPAVVVSEGANFNDTASAHESENTDDDRFFVQRDYSQDSTNGYDDIIIWISPHILRNRMVEAGILP